ncbi:MAG: SelT/SelW/SelH family protein [SAR324 cluster bacterium]|nr:SelT/SelW/SelH family protein [SAR324 cluster bacterium]
MVDEIKSTFQVEDRLIRSGGGIFEVKVDGKQIFSKKRSGRFPIQNEIVNLIRNLQI